MVSHFTEWFVVVHKEALQLSCTQLFRIVLRELLDLIGGQRTDVLLEINTTGADQCAIETEEREREKMSEEGEREEDSAYRSMKFVVTKMIRPSAEITPSSEFSNPLSVNGFIPLIPHRIYFKQQTFFNQSLRDWMNLLSLNAFQQWQRRHLLREWYFLREHYSTVAEDDRPSSFLDSSSSCWCSNRNDLKERRIEQDETNRRRETCESGDSRCFARARRSVEQITTSIRNSSIDVPMRIEEKMIDASLIRLFITPLSRMTEFNGLFRVGCPNKRQSLTKRIFFTSPFIKDRFFTHWSEHRQVFCLRWLTVLHHELVRAFRCRSVDPFPKAVNWTDSNGTPAVDHLFARSFNLNEFVFVRRGMRSHRRNKCVRRLNSRGRIFILDQRRSSTEMTTGITKLMFKRALSSYDDAIW